MAYDDGVATRVRSALARRNGVTERRMFGGLAFMLYGHMACGVQGDTLMVRLGAQEAARALTEPHTKPMDFTGRPLASMVYVLPSGHRRDADLRAWIGRALRFAATLPPKERPGVGRQVSSRGRAARLAQSRSRPGGSLPPSQPMRRK